MPSESNESDPMWLYVRATLYDPDDEVDGVFGLIAKALRHQGLHSVGRSSDISVWPWTEDTEAWRGWRRAVKAVAEGRANGVCVWDLGTLGYRAADMLARVSQVRDLGGEVWTAYPLMRVTPHLLRQRVESAR